MTEIYRTCWNLIVWLGDTPRSPSMMKELPCPTISELRFTYVPQETKARFQLALSSILASQGSLWWQRAWTFAEPVAFGFDPEPEVVMGPLRLPWWLFLELMRDQGLAHAVSGLDANGLVSHSGG